jgi:hypothetical protein
MRRFHYLASAALAMMVMLGLGARSEHGVMDNIIAAVDDYREECTREGCSSEEIEELHESYKEECLNEGCSYEEVRELGGSAEGAKDMLDEFRSRGWRVDNGDYPHCDSFTLGKISTDMPTQPGKMNCKVVFLLTTKCKGLAADGHEYSWTDYGASGVPTSSTQCR